MITNYAIIQGKIKVFSVTGFYRGGILKYEIHDIYEIECNLNKIRY